MDAVRSEPQVSIVSRHSPVIGHLGELPGYAGTTPLVVLDAPRACLGRKRLYVQTSIVSLRSSEDPGRDSHLVSSDVEHENVS